jgi:hypothetical protein
MGFAVVLSSPLASCGKDAEGLFDPFVPPNPDAGACADADCPPNDDAAVDEKTDDVAIATPDASSEDGDGGAGARDATNEVVAPRDGCVASAEVCDGLDNNCNGGVDEGNACPNGCVGLARQGAGYMFCSSNAMHKSWQQAQADCVAHGMHLVRVDDAAENRFINDSAVNLGFLEQIWIGGIYTADASQWQWTDGTPFFTSGSSGHPINGLYSNWTSGEPSNDGIDGCADKLFGDTEVWEDRACSVAFAYFCER